MYCCHQQLLLCWIYKTVHGLLSLLISVNTTRCFILLHFVQTLLKSQVTFVLIMCSSMCSVQAHQQQSSGLEKQSMEAGADWEGRQATGSEASDSRSPSPCLLQRMHLCADMLLQTTERALCCHDCNSRSTKICWHNLSCRCCMSYTLAVVVITSCRRQVHCTSFFMYLLVPECFFAVAHLAPAQDFDAKMTDELDTQLHHPE